jgi:hypothetical protein
MRLQRLSRSMQHQIGGPVISSSNHAPRTKDNAGGQLLLDPMNLVGELLGAHQGWQGPTSFVTGELVGQVQPDEQPDQLAEDGPSTPVHEMGSPPSVEDFIAGLMLPLETPLI